MTLKSLLGIDLPVIQAPMAGVQKSALTIAVSNAGGLGSLPCAMLSHELLGQELALIKAGTTRPFNLNFFCHETPVPDPAAEARWRHALAPYYAEYAIDPDSLPTGAGRVPFSAETAEIVKAFAPPVISFHFGLPSEELMQEVKSWGTKIVSSATTVQEARWLEARGVDAIIAQGLEAGGHRGHFLSTNLGEQMGTFALLPQVAAAVSCPVIAAGGIADADGVVAAMDLGAAGVQIGTAYLLCPEAETSSIHRAALKDEGARHTALTNLFSGRPARSIVNRVMRELGPMSEAPPEFPLAITAIAPLRSKAETVGRGDFSPLWSGQNASGCQEVPAGELTRQLCSELGPAQSGS